MIGLTDYLGADAARGATAGPARVCAQAVMVPVADMLDHRPGEASAWGWHPDTGAYLFELTSASQGCPAGTQFYADYGAYSNAELVLSHGFALWPNLSDAHVVQLAAEPRAATVRARPTPAG